MAGEESASAMEADIIINAADGLPNMHPNLEQLQRNDGDLRGLGDVDIHDDELPNSLIVTNLNSVVFKSDDEKVLSFWKQLACRPHTRPLTHFSPRHSFSLVPGCWVEKSIFEDRADLDFSC